MANLSSDIFDIEAYINQIKRDHIDEDESTLLLGIFGYLGDAFSKITQNTIVMAAETSNEGIGVKARYEKNIIAHAFTAGIQNIYAVPSTMEVLLAFDEAELFPDPENSSITVQRFVFDSNNKIFFGNFEFHPEYNILITKTKLNNNSYAYSAQYFIEKDSNNNDRYNPISDVASTGIFLSPPSIIKGSNNTKLLYIQIPLRQSERYVINKKVVTNNIIESKVFSFDFSAQLAGFTVDIEKADGTNLRLVPVYDGIATDEKQYLYYQFMSTNFIRCKFVDSIYMPAINDQIIINLQTSQGYSGNFYWNPNKSLRFVFDSTKYGLMNQDGSFNGYSAINCMVVPVSSEATGGLDKKSVEELRTIIAKENLARNSITSLTDLKNFFNQINNDTSQVYTYKRRDNQFERLYYAYLLMKNTLNNIVPMNTIAFNVHQTEENLSSDGEIVNVNKNDIIEYFLDRTTDPDNPVTYGEIIKEDITDPDKFGSMLYTVSNNRTPNYKSDTYYIKKHYIVASGTTYYSDKACTTSAGTLAADTYATLYNGNYIVVVSDAEYYVKDDSSLDKSWYFYDTDPTDTVHRYKLTSGLESIGITYNGISNMLTVEYNYSYSSALNVRLPAGDSVLLNNKAFKEKVSAIEGAYNFIYTKYASNPAITKTGAPDISSITVDLSALGPRLDLENNNPTQTFKFSYDLSAAVWKIYNTSTIIELSNYGISYVGTPANGSTIQVVVDVAISWTLRYLPVTLSQYGFTEVGSTPYEIGNKITVSFYYNNNYVYVDKSTSSFFIDDIIVDKAQFRIGVNDDVSADHVFTYGKGSNVAPSIDNLFKSTENTEEGGGIIADDVVISNSSSFYSAIYNDPANGIYNEGTYRFRCVNVIMDPNNIINTSTWADLQSENPDTDSGYDEYTYSTNDNASTLTTHFGLSVVINDYYAPSGTTYYSDTTLSTSAGTLSANTDLDPPTNNRYFTINIGGTNYYIDTNDVEKGKRRALKTGDVIDITYTMWVDGSSQFTNLNDYGITLISSKPALGDTLTFRLHMSTINMNKDSNLFYYECPYDLSINKNPLIAYYKLSYFNMEKRLNFNYINNNSVYQFIAQYMDCKRSYMNNKDIYTITVKAKLNVEDVENLITLYGGKIVQSKIKCMLWLYDSKEETFPSRYTFGNLIDYNEEEYIFTYEFKLETDNQINQENRLSITSKELYVAGTKEKFGQYYDANIKAEVVFAFKNDTQDTSQELFSVVPFLTGYTEANSYFVNDGLDLFYNFSDLINSKVTAELEPGLPLYKAPKGTLYYEPTYYKVPSGTTYYTDSGFITTGGTTTEAVKVTKNGSTYTITIPVGGVMTTYYVKVANVVTVTTASSDYFTPTMSAGSLSDDYSSKSTTGQIIVTAENNPDPGNIPNFNPANDYCPILTPSNTLYYIETEDVITLNNYYYQLDEIPCIKHNYVTNEDIALEFLEMIISEKNYLEYCISVIEDNFSVDFKFFNTYGPSYLYTTDQAGEDPIDKTNISLVFNLKLNSNYDNNITDLIVQDIKGYIEDITKINNLHMNNLTNFISNKYTDSIEFFEFVSINGQTSWRHIYSQQEDDSSYYVSVHPPEFLNVNNREVINTNYISVEPDITINLV